MKQLLLYFSFLVLSVSCMKLSQPVNKENDVIEVVDTQMAELIKEPPISFKDSIELLTFWKQFRKLLLRNDKPHLAEQSLRYVYCPVYDKNANYYSENKLVPLYFFLNAPYRDKYIADFSSYLNVDSPRTFASRLGSQELANFGFSKKEKILLYSLNFDTRQTCNNYTVYRDHSFNFIKEDNSFKFLGVEVYENGSRYQYKLMSFDSLYFPLYRKNADTVSNTNAADTSVNRIYSQQLLQFKEPILYIDNSGDEIFRFTWLRSFHFPVVVRFQKHNETYTLYIKEILPTRGYIPAEFIINTEKKLSAHEWHNLNRKLNGPGFENKDTLIPNYDSEWVLEVKTKNQYFLYHINSTREKIYWDCCKYLLSLSKLKIPKEYQY